MGVDAEMVVRGVRTSVINDEWLKDLSFRLCTAIGAKYFFTSDGLQADEYATANKAWHAAFAAHPLHPEYEAAYAKDRNSEAWRDVASRIRADIGEFKLKERRLAVDLTHRRYRDEESPPVGGEEGGVKPRKGESLLELSLWGRYYGPGYERGQILIYCAIAEWFEENLPGCEVWYGGDTGEPYDLFDEKLRRDLRRHLYSDKGRDYFKESDLMKVGRTPPPKPDACSLCPRGKYHGERFGYGGGDANTYCAYSCSGCGKSVETRDAGATWTEKKDD